MEIYVMSDMHGKYGLFLEMLKLIDFKSTDKLYILGDVLDRGGNPIKILEYIMGNENIELLMGNHEKMFLDYILEENSWEKHINKEIFIRNGGQSTLDEFEKRDGLKQEKIINYLKDLSYYKIIDKFILVHAGVNMLGIKNSLPIEDIMELQNSEDLIWSREEFIRFKAIKDYIVIFGHTVTGNINEKKEDGSYDFSIWYDEIWEDKIGIDCGSYFGKYGGRLACLRLSDLEEFYVEE